MEKISTKNISETRKCKLPDHTNQKPRQFFFRLFQFLSTVVGLAVGLRKASGGLPVGLKWDCGGLRVGLKWDCSGLCVVSCWSLIGLLTGFDGISDSGIFFRKHITLLTLWMLSSVDRPCKRQAQFLESMVEVCYT